MKYSWWTHSETSHRWNHPSLSWNWSLSWSLLYFSFEQRGFFSPPLKVSPLASKCHHSGVISVLLSFWLPYWWRSTKIHNRGGTCTETRSAGLYRWQFHHNNNIHQSGSVLSTSGQTQIWRGASFTSCSSRSRDPLLMYSVTMQKNSGSLQMPKIWMMWLNLALWSTSASFSRQFLSLKHR